MSASRLLNLSIAAATLLILLGCQKSEPRAPSESTAASGDTGTENSTDSQLGPRTQFQGFTIELPSEWKSVKPEFGKTKAMLLKGGTRAEGSKGIIKIEEGPTVGSSAIDMAKIMADKFNGNISENQFDIDGEAAVRVTTDSTHLNAPREVFVVYRKSRAYLVMGVAVKGTDVTGPIIEILRSWRWAS